ncbi:hypothetical protein [Streptomyces sp. TS71-3]|uniref:hypothetical protein n=1 Tax=Streptomyces sp. TS71-3 TaxID=2733862 RepID=UPI001B076055|nr:hypothetical protein [Streptomyces sp. TS71-3]GHJ36288.1 hypothetical protein Sm713_18970 [Streptomyces sp. TS71-3]
MRFLLEVDIDDTPPDADPARELGRILRYWAGNLRHYDLGGGAGSAVHDSAYREVGRWTVTGTQAPPAPAPHTPGPEAP